MSIQIYPQLNMLLPRVVRDNSMFSCGQNLSLNFNSTKYSNIQNRLSIKTNTPSESGEIGKKAKSSVYLKRVKACLMT